MKSFFVILILLTGGYYSAVGQIADTTAPIFIDYEIQPRFPGCEMIPLTSKRSDCAREKLNAFIEANLIYPKQLRFYQGSFEGRVIVKFIISPTGKVSQAEVVRDICEGCGEAALNMVRQMPDWIPGIQRGRPVPVTMHLPVLFKS